MDQDMDQGKDRDKDQLGQLDQPASLIKSSQTPPEGQRGRKRARRGQRGNKPDRCR